MITKEVDCGLHILKGAVEKVLEKTLVTTSVYGKENKGSLTIEFDRDLTEQEIQDIETQANNKIAENVRIEVLEMDRKDAEEKFGNVIYDKYPVPENITKLRVVRIKDWNLNCCIGEHFDTTGGINSIKILKHNFRESKNEVEISFSVD